MPDINIMAKVPRNNIRKAYESMGFNKVNKKDFLFLLFVFATS